MAKTSSMIAAFVAGLVGVVVLAVTWHGLGWAEPSNQRGYPVTSYFTECIGFGFVAAYAVVSWLLGRTLKHPQAVAFGMVAPFPIGAIFEMTRDSTSHNLIPFEIALYWVPAFAIALATAALGARDLKRNDVVNSAHSDPIQ